MRRSRLLEPAGWSLVRTPLVPASGMRVTGCEGAGRPLDDWIALALAVGSPDLSAALSRRAAGPDGSTARPRDARLQLRRARFRIRMATRPTPYGLFAGVALAHWGDHTDLALAASPPRTRSRPDMQWLLGLIGALERDPVIRGRLRVERNPMLLDAAGRLSVPETAMAADAAPGEDASVRATGLARRAVEMARTPIGYDQLADALIAPGASREEVEAILEIMCRHEILLTDLRAAPTRGDPVTRLREQLAETGVAAGTVAALDELRTELAGWDVLPPGERLAQLPALGARMARLHPTPPSVCPVQVDMAMALDGHQIHRSVASEAARAAELLLRISPYPNGLPHIRAYRSEFVRRYGLERPVPLLELLDPVVGLGPPALGPDTPTDPEAPARVARRDRVLQALAASAQRDGRRVVELDDTMLAQLETWNASLETAPVSMELLVLVAAASTAALDAGDFRLVVSPNVGAAPAGRHTNRFTDLLGPAAEQVLADVAAIEGTREPGRLQAELVYLPAEPRAANLIVHPSARSAEIAINAPAGLRVDHVVRLDDLVVRLGEGGFRIDWTAGLTPVAGVPGHMLNPRHAPAVARFLLDVEADRQPVLSPFDWGSSAGAPFLPRVQSGRVVLAPAQWRLPAPSMPGGGETFTDALAAWRRDWAVPRHVYLVQADNRLLLDLDGGEGVAILREEAEHHAAVSHGLVLHEAVPGLEDAWLQGPHGGHLVELVVPFVRRAQVRRASGEQPRRGFPHPAPAVHRLRPPGSEWLYLKLCCAPASQDELIAGPLRDISEFAVGAGLADRWFFIRFADPEPHLRIRFHGQPVVLLGALLDEVCAWAGELLGEGICQRFSIETYEREVERYGGTSGIEVAEDVFAADSDAVCELLHAVRRSRDSPDIADVALLGIDRLLTDCGVGGPDRLDWLRRHARLTREDGAAHRARKAQLRRLLHSETDAPTSITTVLDRRRRALAGAAARLGALEADGALERPRAALLADFVHLHCNRMLGATPPQEQRLLALLRRTREALSAQQAAPTPSARG